MIYHGGQWGHACSMPSQPVLDLEKLHKKNADMIVANNVKAEGAGFGTDTNIVTLFKHNGEITELPLMSKRAVAKKIIDEIAFLLKDMDKNENC